MGKVNMWTGLPDGSGSVTGRTLEWCREHIDYDGCIASCGCRGTCVVHADLDAGRRRPDYSWCKIPVPEVGEALTFKCSCSCHARKGPNETCATWCCKKLRSELRSACLCLCHDVARVECKGMSTCCGDFCRKGETDENPNEILDTDVWPYSASISTRIWNKKNMSDTMHLHMTVEGDTEGVDLFHLILGTVDKDYPRKPMAKPSDTIPICSGCQGLVWENMILTPPELIKAAKDATEGAGTPVMVKIHRWWKGSKCNKKHKNAKIERVAV